MRRFTFALIGALLGQLLSFAVVAVLDITGRLPTPLGMADPGEQLRIFFWATSVGGLLGCLVGGVAGASSGQKGNLAKATFTLWNLIVLVLLVAAMLAIGRFFYLGVHPTISAGQ